MSTAIATASSCSCHCRSACSLPSCCTCSTLVLIAFRPMVQVLLAALRRVLERCPRIRAPGLPPRGRPEPAGTDHEQGVGRKPCWNSGSSRTSSSGPPSPSLSWHPSGADYGAPGPVWRDRVRRGCRSCVAERRSPPGGRRDPRRHTAAGTRPLGGLARVGRRRSGRPGELRLTAVATCPSVCRRTRAWPPTSRSRGMSTPLPTACDQPERRPYRRPSSDMPAVRAQLHQQGALGAAPPRGPPACCMTNTRCGA